MNQFVYALSVTGMDKWVGWGHRIYIVQKALQQYKKVFMDIFSDMMNCKLD